MNSPNDCILYPLHAFVGKICDTEVCKETAATLLRNMDKTVNPCDDFYQFACGNYMKSFAIPNDKMKVNPVSQLEDQIDFQLRKSILEVTKKDLAVFQKLKILYESCSDEESIERKGNKEFQKLIKSFGGWPVLEKSWSDSKFDWKKLMYDFQKAGFSSVFFINVEFVAHSDSRNREEIHLKATSTALHPGILSEGLKNSKVKRYFDFMIDLATILGADYQHALEDLIGSLKFEIELAKINHEFLRVNRYGSENHRMTIKELQTLCPSIPWLEYITKILPLKGKLSSSTTITTIPTNIIKSYCELFLKTPKRALANYAFFHISVDSLPYLNSQLRMLKLSYEDIFEKRKDQKRGQPRWRTCIEEVKTLMPVAVGALYIRKHFDRQDKAEVTKLVSYIERSVRATFKEVQWMHQKDQMAALDKINAMVSVIGYPGELLEDSEINNFYKKLAVQSNKSFLKTILSLNLFNVKLYENRLAEPFNIFHWSGISGHAAKVEAMYILSHNVFYIMAGFLQGIFFNPRNPKYINFAGVGSTVGHEMMHAFDGCESHLNEPGKYYRNCWDPTTVRKFHEKTECLVSQYDKLARSKNLQVNGLGSLRENIADNAGVKHAYHAYNQWVKDYGSDARLFGMEEYSPKKLFWLAYANNYCEWSKPGMQLVYGNYAPPQLRVNGPLINMREFSQEFNCPVGSFMNPPRKCSVW
ncbi:hypothetical protein QAD02_006579 [Eretmocerus hayati]|uniref:Uncharacterized protein n=1 Tax=Eretmocerus hayati TaxID=131215 RepID=A0ACC2N3L8_9HYME|nr:hypothetical protein QAD02_006579 [Eretmocerus hayati]